MAQALPSIEGVLATCPFCGEPSCQWNCESSPLNTLQLGDSQNLYNVLTINENGFAVETRCIASLPNATAFLSNGNIFVYGKEVNDFHTVDYEALSTLNISATQALVKRLNDLEAQNATLKRKLDKVETDMKAFDNWVCNADSWVANCLF